MSEHPKIFVFCDSPKHAKRVAVTNFAPSNRGWSEIPASKAPIGHPGAGLIGTGRQMVRDKPAEPGWANDPNVSNADTRERFELRCRKCPANVVINRDTLESILDGWRATGMPEISLNDLAASIGRSKTAD